MPTCAVSLYAWWCAPAPIRYRGWALNFVLTILQLQTEAIDLAKVLVDADYRCGLWLILSELKFPPRPNLRAFDLCVMCLFSCTETLNPSVTHYATFIWDIFQESSKRVVNLTFCQRSLFAWDQSTWNVLQRCSRRRHRVWWGTGHSKLKRRHGMGWRVEFVGFDGFIFCNESCDRKGERVRHWLGDVQRQ